MYWSGFGFNGELPMIDMIGNKEAIRYQAILEESYCK
jgi:hypothetical protein